jgi:uncharacterized membrane protein
MIALDAVWLTALQPVIRRAFATIQGQPLQFRWWPSALVYVLMIAGLWFFAIQPATSWIDAAGRGGALGALVYGVYDFTNYATLVRYPLHLALGDWAWGTFLFGVTAAVATLAK